MRVLSESQPALDCAATSSRSISGVLYYSVAPGDVDTYCMIYDAGTKRVTISFVGLIPGPGEDTATTSRGGSCVTAPLEPDHSCVFSGTRSTIYGGGVAHVHGSAKNLRGSCSLHNYGTSALLVAQPMR